MRSAAPSEFWSDARSEGAPPHLHRINQKSLSPRTLHRPEAHIIKVDVTALPSRSLSKVEMLCLSLASVGGLALAGPHRQLPRARHQVGKAMQVQQQDWSSAGGGKWSAPRRYQQGRRSRARCVCVAQKMHSC